MEKLPMCRICLVQNVRMFLVASRNLRDLYEKLTDIPFVTKDSRPILACFICCTKLKQCYRLLRQCLEAEELFAKRMNEDYEPNPLINPGHFGFYSGFIKSPTENISIVDDVLTESIDVKEELPAVCEELYVIIEPKKEHQDELENFDNSCLDVADILPHHSKSYLEDDVPLMEFKTEVEEEQEVSKKKRRATGTTKSIAVKEEPPAVCEGLYVIIEPKEEHQSDELEQENLDNSCLDVADILPHHSESDLEDDLPLMEFKTEVGEQEVSKKKRRATGTTRATVAKKRKLDTRRTNEKDAITAEQMRKNKSDSKIFRTTHKRTSKPGTYFKEPYKCDQDSFSVMGALTKHMLIHADEKPYKCDLCQRSFNEEGSLKNHIRVHTGDNHYKCDLSQHSISEEGSLKNPISVHTGDNPYKRDVCQRSFTEKSSLNNHIRIHTGEKPYKCDICGRRFSQLTSLKRHILIHTGEKPYKCSVCQRNFHEKDDLIKHVRTHTGEKPYKCDVCQRTFNQKSNLTNHIRIHTGDTPYKCDVCQRNFSHRGSLKYHNRIHAGENPYKCNVCQRSFSEKGSLKNHIRIHTGEKPYKCDICGRGFSQVSNLKSHIRIHTGEKPYKCDICGRGFAQVSNLKRHVLMHTGEKH